MKKVLVAVDGSLASIHAMRQALEICEVFGAKLSVAHVTPPTILPGDVPIAPITQLREAELTRGAAVLDQVLSSSGVPPAKVETRNLLGSPAEVLADVALDEGFDLVVVGNKGHNAVTRVLLGSVADRLVHISKKPVLVVR
jgi:nucleotide-binding universal stress UspA family protein